MNSQTLSGRQFVWLTACAIGGGCLGLPAAVRSRMLKCRGAWQKLLPEVRDSHWVAYSDWLKELGYATRKIGVKWVSLTDTA